MAKRVNKYQYLKVLQGDYGCGWEDLCEYETADPVQMKECRDDLKAYRENEREYSHRVIRRRVLNPEWRKLQTPEEKPQPTVDMDWLKENLLLAVMECGIGDLKYCFSGMDWNLLVEGVQYLKEQDICMNACNLWTEAVYLAACRVFGTQSDFVYTTFNFMDNHIYIRRSSIQYIENFYDKKGAFEKLVNQELEVED